MEDLEYSTLPLNPYALGMVADFVSHSLPFANFEFSRVLRALSFQLSFGTHLIASKNDELVGYLGWIKTTDVIAEEWISNDRILEPALAGNVVVITILAVSDPKFILNMIKTAKKIHPAQRVIWRRYFADNKQSQIRQVSKRNSN